MRAQLELLFGTATAMHYDMPKITTESENNYS
jgi:hypothetical protein